MKQTMKITDKSPYGIEAVSSTGFRDITVIGEIEAMNLIGWPSSTDSKFTPHDAGNQIIELAERIKAQRAVMGMV